jgi:deoxyribodipyrimidine photo-lyase
MPFATHYQEILDQIESVNPIAYGKTRNFIDGAVTKLSPYISRGVISLSMIKETVLKKYNRHQSEKLLQELAWREYWLRVWETKGALIFSDLKQIQLDVDTHEISTALMNASTGIRAIDDSVNSLYETGYMHNHCRMYVASVACNIAKAHWLQPSKWMYYHLLDGDLASNSLSWQWVAGSFSSKKYFCNQENINRYCYTQQTGTFLDRSYDELSAMDKPAALEKTVSFNLSTTLPATAAPIIDEAYPTLIYNAYNLDPQWHQHIKANRILLLEPSHYRQYPVSEKVIEFILALSENIPGIQVYAGTFDELKKYAGTSKIIFKKHPAFMHYKGEAESNNYLFPQVSGYFNSFFSYWKKCEKFI